MQISFCLVSAVLFCNCNGANILAIIPSPGFSQYLLGSSLMKALAARGHQVLVISPFQQGEQISNYEEIVVKSIVENFEGEGYFEFESSSIYSSIMAMYGSLSLKFTTQLLQDNHVQQLLRSNAHFDLVICEQFFNEAHMGFAHHFKAPLVAFSTIGASEWTNQLLGNPSSWSVAPNLFSSYTDTMNFKQRLRNTMFGVFERLYKHLIALPRQNQILKTHFPNTPELHDLMYNVSLVLLNSNTGVTRITSLLPNMVEIGGFHISRSKLPGHLQTFLDEASNGVIYFGMGTNLEPNKVSARTSMEILQCFSTLKQRVIWKWKDLSDVPKNVQIGKWFPQQDVLGHPNLRLFITHGGLISIIESIHYGVPIIGIPIFGDQKMNIAFAVSKGYGLKIPFKNLSGQVLCTAINEILTNISYKKEAVRRSQIMKSQPMQPMEKAIFWIEYVLRFGRTSELRSSTLDRHWFQYYLLDVIVCMIIIAVLSVLMCILLLKLLFAKKQRRKIVKKD